MRRTQAASGDEGTDLMAWSLPRILREVDERFQAALKDAPTLRKIKVKDYEAILTPANVPDSYRPTLFDFLAFEALKFYSAGIVRYRYLAVLLLPLLQ